MCLKSPHPKPGQREGPSIDTITLMSQVFLLMVAFTPVGKFIWATNVCKVKVHLAFQEVKVHQNHGMCYSPPVQKALLCSVCTGRKRKALRTESRGLFNIFVLQALIPGPWHVKQDCSGIKHSHRGWMLTHTDFTSSLQLTHARQAS